VFRLVPGHSDDVIINGMRHSKELKAVVVQVLGQGTIGSDKVPLLSAIKQAVERGVLVVACSQCLKGRVSLDTYAAASALGAAGAIGARDMTVEAIVAKLGYLLGQQLPIRQVRRLFVTDMRGELSPDEDTEEVHYSIPRNFTSKL
jgi:L-asparaginase